MLRTDGEGIDLSALALATGDLRHRGPDDEGYLVGSTARGQALSLGGPDTDASLCLAHLGAKAPFPADLALGFRRLAVLDPSAAGHQPMASTDGRLWIVFNGEIYNHPELRRELEKDGYPFCSGTDTETLLAAWQHWGAECLDRLEGMWAFSLWDVERRLLHLCRDRFGIKPLYCRAEPGQWSFASEIPPLLRFGRRPPGINAAALFRFLRFGITDAGSRTLFSGIQRIPPARLWTLDLAAGGAPHDRRYWQLPASTHGHSELGEAALALRGTLLNSVRAHLLSDVPLGVSLSGGLDSSSILCTLRQVLPDQLPIHAFAQTAPQFPQIDETRWIEAAAGAARASLQEVTPTAEDLRRDLAELVRLQGEPFGSTSIYAQFRVFRLAREAGITVVLGGQGADELLAGYPAYLGAKLAGLAASLDWLPALRLLRRIGRQPGGDRRGALARAIAQLIPGWLEPLARRVAGEELAPRWLDAGWFRERGVNPSAPALPPERSPLRARLRQAIEETSLPMLLRFEDRNSMANSIESRVPFLTRPVVELLAGLPDSFLIDDHATAKVVLRRAMEGLVPDPILRRRDKIGFATPERAWLEALSGWVGTTLSGAAAQQVQGLRPAALLEEWKAVEAGRRRFDFRIWRGLNLVCWAQTYDVGFDPG